MVVSHSHGNHHRKTASFTKLEVHNITMPPEDRATAIGNTLVQFGLVVPEICIRTC